MSKSLSTEFSFLPKTGRAASFASVDAAYPFFTSSQDTVKRSAEADCYGPALVFGTGGSASVHVVDGPFSASNDCYVCKPDSGKMDDAKFVHYFLKSNIHLIEKGFKGAGLKHVSKKHLMELEIPTGEGIDRRRVVALLDKVDAIRRKREQALTLADDFLRSVFLEMFGDPGENPMNWDREPLSLQAEVKIGFPFKSAEYVEEGIRLCRGANTMPDRLEWSDTRYWPVSDAARFAEYALVSGDIILALDRPWISSGLKVAEVIQADLPALLVQRVARIRSSVPAEKPFVFQCLRHPSFWSYCNPTETTIPHISPVELKNYPMIKPPRELVAAFGVIAAKQSVLRQKVEQDAKDARQLFQSLSQRAFAADL